MFGKKQKLRKEYDAKLVELIRSTKQDLDNIQHLEGISDDFELSTIAQKKIAESQYFYLFKEARIRKVLIK
ncbi:YaaL family protein [Kurthia senegalensis]|uniref:YaaL family protein n=1 Tax=Kurthia senegalensis TaxID=1033740 RepID=UPI00028A0069|nr:YaaL family protein [Kurthia senegalensis]